jgi:hypothetical protein
MPELTFTGDVGHGEVDGQGATFSRELFAAARWLAV